jgi:hypothetical protein
MNREQADRLRTPFPKSAIGKLPKAGLTLEYVGHAAVTDRLLAVDPDWTWEPLAYGENGQPRILIRDKEAWLWARLTVCGVTRIECGTAPVNAFDLPKQLVSDFLRRGAMRFGVGLDLWSKEELGTQPPAPDRQHEAELHEVQTAGAAVVAQERVAKLKQKQAAASPLDQLRHDLTARAHALSSRDLAEHRKAAGLPLIRDSDAEALAAWRDILQKLEDN